MDSLKMLPTCLVFKSEAINDIKEIHPFNPHLYEIAEQDILLDPGEYRLTPHKACISKIVDYFFGSNENYFWLRPKKEVKPISLEIESYHLLLTSTDLKTDSRIGLIEVELNKGIPLNGDT